MKDYKDMTPIELNHLLNKVKEDHELIKTKIREGLDTVEKLEVEINQNIKLLGEVEAKYVEIMAILMEKQ